MAFNRLMLTTRGKTLSAKAQQGKKLDITRVGVGDGRLNGGSLVNRAELIRQTLSLPIDLIQLTDEGSVAAVIVTLSNEGLAEGFYFRELGVFAKDPDTGAELLYLYDNADPDGEFIPDGDSGTLVLERLKLLVSIDGMADVSFSNSGNPIYLTREDLSDELDGKADLDPVTGKVLTDQLPMIPALFGPVMVNVLVSGWSGSGPWVQTVAVSGVTAKDTGLGVYPVDIADVAARKRYEKAYGCLSPEAETGESCVTLTCRAGKPETDFQVTIKGVR